MHLAQFRERHPKITSDATIAFFLAAAILYLRKPDSILNPQFWAEDGNVFFQQSATMGWSSIGQTIDGYYLFIPRIISIISHIFIPLIWLPAAYNYSAWVLSACMCAWFACARLDLKYKWVFAIIPLFMPYGDEVWLTITNLQWLLALILVVLCIQSPATTRKMIIIDSILAVTVGLTGLFSVIILPLFCIRMLVYRAHKGELILFISVALAAFCQLYGLYYHFDPISDGTFQWMLFFRWIMWVFCRLLNAPPFCVIVLFGFLIVAIGRIPLVNRIQIVILALFDFYILFSIAYRCGGKIPAFTLCATYYYLPCAVTAWIFFIIAAKAPHTWKIPGFAALVLCAISTSQNFFFTPFPDLHWKTHIEALHGESQIPINPAGWSVHVVKP